MVLEGKVALVTGGSRGLGREMVRAFAREGADVVIASRKLDACEALAAEVRSSFGRRALAVAANVGAWDDCDALADAAYAEFGRVDVLVNNAGMSPLYESLDGVTEALWDKVAGVNLKGPFRLSSVVGTRMAAGDGGAIIFISSIAARQVGTRELPYAAAKAGVEILTEGMAQAFGPSVRVNCISPGAFATDISDAWPPEMFDAIGGATALRRVGRPDEIVGTALYLAGDASSYVTGAVLRVDGAPRPPFSG